MKHDQKKFATLTDLVLQMREHMGDIPPSVTDLRQQAAFVAARAFGDRMGTGAISLINVAALAILSSREPNRLISHRLTRGAQELVRETDLRALPGSPPHLLAIPWIAEVRQLESDRLFADTVSFGCYPLDDQIFMVGLRWPDGVCVGCFTPRWQERELAVSHEDEENPFIAPGHVEAHDAWSHEATRWALLFAIHREAEHTPVVYRDTIKRGRKTVPGASTPRGPDAWVERRIFLDRITRWAAGTPAEGQEEQRTSGATDNEGRKLANVFVRGHMRRQPFGPGGEGRKWVYVAGYEARRWTSPKPLRIVVDRSQPSDSGA